MARSLGQELRDPPNPAQLADMVVHHSFDNRSKPGTDLQHSGLQRRSQASETERDGQGAAAAAQTGDGVGRCVSFDEAPLYLRREFIMSGYYVGGNHLASVRRTLFGWNNETLNSWTMIAGLLLTICATVYARLHFPTHWQPLGLMAASALPHAPFSIALHATIGVSQRTRDMLRTLDVFFILTCGVPRGLALAWFVFPGALSYWLYAAVISADWVWTIWSTCLTRRIKDIPKPQLARDISATVLCYMSPMMLASLWEVFTQGWPGPQTALTAAVVALMYAAAWLYSRHLPERWRPGAYDLVGNSHQWMHALVVLEYGLEWCFVMYKAEQVTAI